MPADNSRSPGLHRTLGVMDLVFLNIAAILGIRWLSTAAQMGPSALALWVLIPFLYMFAALPVLRKKAAGAPVAIELTL